MAIRGGLTFTYLLIPAFLLAGQKPALRHEGEFWVEKTSGSEAVGESEQIKIVCSGNVSIHGEGGSQLDYALKRRVRARNEAQARDMLSEAGVSVNRHGRYMTLLLNEASGPVDVDISLPKSLSSVTVASTFGNIEVDSFRGSLTAQTGGGNIRTDHVRGNQELRSAGGLIRLIAAGDNVHAVTNGGDVTADSIAGAADLETAGGDVTVQKVGDKIHAYTAGGTVRIEEAGGAVRAETAGGQIEIGKAKGTVVARNAGGGPIQITSAAGGVLCDSASGAIKASGISGLLKIQTRSGAVVAQVLGQLSGDSFVSTGSGDITIYLPSNLNVTVHAQNNGATRAQSITSDFNGVHVRVDGAAVLGDGALNGGGPSLRIQGNGGIIAIKKK